MMLKYDVFVIDAKRKWRQWQKHHKIDRMAFLYCMAFFFVHELKLGY